MIDATIEQPDAEEFVSLIDTIGTRLRSTFLPIVEAAAGTSPRPTRLGTRLGIDKSLASRIVRALRCESNLELIYGFPSPSGLRIFLARARRAGIDRPLLDVAEAEVERFQLFIQGTPGGMDAIHAHIAETSIEVREKREHVARQAAYKAMSFLLGYYCETLTTTLILVPSANGRSVDGIEIHQRLGMHRLRPHTPLALLSVMTPPKGRLLEDATWVEPIDGRAVHRLGIDGPEGEIGQSPPDPSSFILSEFSTQPIPRIEVLTEGVHTTFVLAEPDRPPHKTLSLTTAFRIRNGWPLTSMEGMNSASRGYVLPTPCRRLVRTLYVAEEIYPGSVPEVTFQLQNPAGASRDRAHKPCAGIDRLDLCAPIEHLEPGPRGSSISRLPQYLEAVSGVLEMIGSDLSRFRGYRCSIAYPVPLIEMRWTLKITP